MDKMEKYLISLYVIRVINMMNFKINYCVLMETQYILMQNGILILEMNFYFQMEIYIVSYD